MDPDFVYPGLDKRDDELKEEKARLTTMVDDLRADGCDAQAFMKGSQPIADFVVVTYFGFAAVTIGVW